MSLSVNEYKKIQNAYDYFNNNIFNDSLPNVLITFQRKKGSAGYFSPLRFDKRGDGKVKVDELALNPRAFGTDKEILEVLVHEMVHVWQSHHGNPPKRGNYHNIEWSRKMESIGLMPSSTGSKGGNKTGTKMSHYTIDGGVFDIYANDLLRWGFRIEWEDNTFNKNQEQRAKKNKTKFTCPNCGINVWGKPELSILCMNCNSQLITECNKGE